MVMVMVIYGDGDVRCDGDVFAYAEAALRRPASNTASILTYLSTAFQTKVYGIKSMVSSLRCQVQAKSVMSSLWSQVYY